MMKFKYIFLGLALMILSNGCKKDIITSETSVTSQGPIQTIESSVTGLVTDQEGIALADVSVQYRGDIIKTDENGYFKVKNASAVFDGGLLKFNQEGYFKNYKWFYPQLDDNSFVRVIMVKETLRNTISNSAGGTVELNGGATVSFPPNAFEGPDGEYKVYGYWYNPTSDKLTEEMPGDLRAINSEEALVQLATYGMVAVEIRDANDNDIQLKDNILATIEFPLPDELAQSAAETIKTWSFEEDRAYWIEEGTATLEGGKYFAEVSHFSFWNCDAPFPIIHLKARLVNEDGIQLPGVKICITDLDRANTRSGWTSYKGVFQGKVPKDTPLKLVAKDECNGVLYEKEIGGFSEDTDLGDIIAETGNFVNVSGTLICEGQPLSNGYALIALTSGAQFIAEVDSEGNFEINLPFCELKKISIKGYNLDNNSTSDWVVFEDFESILNTDEIEICEDAIVLDEYIIYKMNNGQEIILEFPAARLINGQLRILDSDMVTNSVTLIIDNPQAGAVTVKRLAANIVSQQLSGECGSTLPTDPECTEMTANLSAEYEPTKGSYIEGDFMGTLISANGETIEVMGSFRVILEDIINEYLISGYVWEDTTNDGIRDASDQAQSPPNFSRVSLVNSGEILETTFTRPGDGFYSFLVQEGTYQLRFTKPAGYKYVPQGQGNDPTIDSDVDPSTGSTELFVVDGSTDYNFDVGLFWDNTIDCDDLVLQIDDASCGSANGRYRLILQDSLPYDGYTIETFDGLGSTSQEYIPWEYVNNLAAGFYTYALYDENGEVVCSEDFTIQASNVNNCTIIGAEVICDGPEYYGLIEYDCSSNQNSTILWETGETGQQVTLTNPGNYNLTITDDQGCSAELVATFINFPMPTIEGKVWLDTIFGTPNVYDDFDRTLSGVTVHLYANGEIEESTETGPNGDYVFGNIDLNFGGPYRIGLEVPDTYELVLKEDPNDPDLESDSAIDPETGLSDEFFMEDCNESRQVWIGLKPL